MDTNRQSECFDDLEALAQKAKETRLIYVTLLYEQNVSIDEQNTVQWLTTRLGERSWSHALIVFTHPYEAPRKFAETLQKRSALLRAEIAKHTGWDIATSITTMALANLNTLALDNLQWLPEHYSPQGAASYLFVTAAYKDAIPSEPQLTFNLRKIPDTISSNTLSDLPDYMATLAGFYLSSAPVAAAGMLVAGTMGCGVAFIGNAVIWTLIGLYRHRHARHHFHTFRHHSHDGGAEQTRFWQHGLRHPDGRKVTHRGR